MPMQTRRAINQEMSSKLKLALEELKYTKAECQQLLQEREESEEELSKINEKNTSLKRELVALHNQLQEVVEERDKLQLVTDGFNHCSDLYEEALCKVRDLEDELNHANLKICNYQKQEIHAQAVATDHLYNQLINSSSNQNDLGNLINIDLTDQNSLANQSSTFKPSHNKVKKYIKLNKIMRKCNRLKKQQKHFSNTNQLRKERIALLDKLKNYQIKLEDCKNIYEVDTQQLQSEISSLEKSLQSLYSKYVISQKQIDEHILAANNLVDICNYNADRADSLTNYNSNCTCQSKTTNIPLSEVAESPAVAEILDCSVDVTLRSCTSSQVIEMQICSDSNKSTSNTNFHSLMFSDSIGKGFGVLLGNSLEHSVQNYCLPGVHYNQIVESIMKDTYNSKTDITVFVGNCLNIRKKDITDSFTSMLKLKCHKIRLCAFPYLDNLSSRQNNYIYMLNKHMQFLISHHSDKFTFFDTNTFVGPIKMTRDTVYLPNKFKVNIATLLAYNIKLDVNSLTRSFCTNIAVSEGSVTRDIPDLN